MHALMRQAVTARAPPIHLSTPLYNLCKPECRSTAATHLDLFSLQQQLELGILVPLTLSLHLLQRLGDGLFLFSIGPLQLSPASGTTFCHPGIAGCFNQVDGAGDRKSCCVKVSESCRQAGVAVLTVLTPKFPLRCFTKQPPPPKRNKLIAGRLVNCVGTNIFCSASHDRMGQWAPVEF